MPIKLGDPKLLSYRSKSRFICLHRTVNEFGIEWLTDNREKLGLQLHVPEKTSMHRLANTHFESVWEEFFGGYGIWRTVFAKLSGSTRVYPYETISGL